MQEDLGQAASALDTGDGEGAWLAVDEEASLLLVSRGSRVAGRIVALSMTGCRISVWEKLPAGVQLRVEASFRVNGIAFRLSGVTESNDGHRLVGIRFQDMTSRRTDELLEVLAELTAEARKRAEKEAAKAALEAAQVAAGAEPSKATAPRGTIPAQPEKSSSAAKQPVSAPPTLHLLESRPAANRPPPLPPLAAAANPQEASNASQPPKPKGRERRTQGRHDVDTSAVIHLVNVSSRIGGRIQNLSMGGCRIFTNDRFPVGIYTRVETEFQLEGLSFRLGGVVQAIQDKQHVGIRFLDISERKRALLEQLIEEIEALHEREKNTAGQTPHPHPPQV